MSGRQSSAVAAAVRMVQRGHSVTEAAAKHGCNVRSVRRALRLAEIPPLSSGRPAKEA
ncbi:MAG: helix-turn-helix domain-containing protein [Xanthomonadales bacterium]|nr:helix-turn-helix domain-containing protein [Xanthomonadales bacterium]